jgi:hypothetical protein
VTPQLQLIIIIIIIISGDIKGKTESIIAAAQDQAIRTK